MEIGREETDRRAGHARQRLVWRGVHASWASLCRADQHRSELGLASIAPINAGGGIWPKKVDRRREEERREKGQGEKEERKMSKGF